MLRAPAGPVPKNLFGSEELGAIIERMVRAVRAEPYGVAIAAPQIGVPYRIFVVRGYVLKHHERNDDDADVAFINPTIIRKSKKTGEMSEGCLSVPGVFGTTTRSVRATIRAQTPDGVEFERGGSGLIAQIFQHECDHLDGVLFIDHAHSIGSHESEQ